MTSKASNSASRSPRAAKVKREKLHRLIDELPAREVEAALRYVGYLRSTIDPDIRHLMEAPYDDKPETEEERQAVAEAWGDYRAGRVLSDQEVQRRVIR